MSAGWRLSTSEFPHDAGAKSPFPKKGRSLFRCCDMNGSPALPGKAGEPFISQHLKRLRPFLGKGDFAPASWGNSLIDSLQPADITVEKVAYSAFYQTRMEYSLSKAGIKTLFICGIVTNGGVASTVRDAHVRDFHTITLEDGCAAFSQETHKLAIQSLETVGEVMKIQDAISLINGN